MFFFNFVFEVNNLFFDFLFKLRRLLRRNLIKKLNWAANWAEERRCYHRNFRKKFRNINEWNRRRPTSPWTLDTLEKDLLSILTNFLRLLTPNRRTSTRNLAILRRILCVYAKNLTIRPSKRKFAVRIEFAFIQFRF